MKDLSLHMLDIIRNAVSAGACTITTVVLADICKDMLVLSIEDDGKGMDENMRRNVIDPFVTTRSTRKIGLGIPFLQSSARQSGGDLKISSEIGKGTTVTADFRISNIDRLPLGDIAETVANIIASDPEIRFILILGNGSQSFRFDTLEVKERLGGVSIAEYNVIAWIKEYLEEGIKTIFGGVLHEVNG